MQERRIPPCLWILSQSRKLALPGKHVVVLDEHALVADYAAFLDAPGTRFLTNRWNVLEQFKAATAYIEFSDFDFSRYEPGSVAALFFRVAKEKAIVHHVINSAAHLLADHGTLHICGLRKEGVKTYIEKADPMFIGKKHVKTTRIGARCGVLTKRGELRPAGLLPDDEYAQLRVVKVTPELSVHTKPGIFGWRKEDPGSALLASVAEVPVGASVLDLGCGYGYLAIKAAQRGAGRVWATDNNAAALAACQRNFQAFNIPGEVRAGDCGDTVTGTFDVVLCNPPFHEGFRVNSELTCKFLGAISRLLAAEGVAFVVVNSFITIEKAAASVFTGVDTITDNGKFKVVRLHAPAR